MITVMIHYMPIKQRKRKKKKKKEKKEKGEKYILSSILSTYEGDLRYDTTVNGLYDNSVKEEYWDKLLSDCKKKSDK